jgi:predicted RNA binding protein YcfA (HicA-like mRNA interferase family)
MSKQGKLIQAILQGQSDSSIAFRDLCNLLIKLGFEKRSRGSHFIFIKAGVEERLNLQKDGNKAKPYQVRQIRSVLVKYRLTGEIDA